MSTFTPEQIQEILDLYFENFAHRQYIGARYVPIFGRKDEDSIEWDNTGTYEPLTIVLYQGNSFTSRQFVPIGVDINNTDYWAETGNYNAQIEVYRQEVLQFDDRIETLEKQTQFASYYGIEGLVDIIKINDYLTLCEENNITPIFDKDISYNGTIETTLNIIAFGELKSLDATALEISNKTGGFVYFNKIKSEDNLGAPAIIIDTCRQVKFIGSCVESAMGDGIFVTQTGAQNTTQYINIDVNRIASLGNGAGLKFYAETRGILDVNVYVESITSYNGNAVEQIVKDVNNGSGEKVYCGNINFHSGRMYAPNGKGVSIICENGTSKEEISGTYFNDVSFEGCPIFIYLRANGVSKMDAVVFENVRVIEPPTNYCIDAIGDIDGYINVNGAINKTKFNIDTSTSYPSNFRIYGHDLRLTSASARAIDGIICANHIMLPIISRRVRGEISANWTYDGSGAPLTEFNVANSNVEDITIEIPEWFNLFSIPFEFDIADTTKNVYLKFNNDYTLNLHNISWPSNVSKVRIIPLVTGTSNSILPKQVRYEFVTGSYYTISA